MIKLRRFQVSLIQKILVTLLVNGIKSLKMLKLQTLLVVYVLLYQFVNKEMLLVLKIAFIFKIGEKKIYKFLLFLYDILKFKKNINFIYKIFYNF